MPKKTGEDLFTGNVPKMPNGYYSGDQANPNLGSFVEAHKKERPYDPMKDSYDIKPLLTSTKVKRTTKIFNMHTYWSKKPHESVEAYVMHYTRQGDLVLDPFCGSGGAILVSAFNGRKAVGIDLSPAATFLSATLCSPPPLRDFDHTFEAIMRKLRLEYSWLYEYPYKGKMWQIHFGISSMRFQCIKCLRVSSLYKCGNEEGANCPHCGEVIKTTQEKFGYQLDEWHLYVKQGMHHIVKIDGETSEYEKMIQQKIQKGLNIHIPPRHMFPKAGCTQRLFIRGISDLTKLYTARNLLALCLYRDACISVNDEKLRNALLFVLTACSLKTSRMMGLNSDGIGRIQKNGLIAQLIVKDVNVFDFLEIAKKGITSGFADILSKTPKNIDCIFSTKSAVDLSEIPSCSVDYIFTDPPYGARVQFWESNQVWEAWLGLNTNWQDRELIVNRLRNLDEDHWRQIFRDSMKECYRVLKPGRWITLTYNDRETWPILQDVMLDMGFIPDGSDSPVVMETTAKSEKQLKGEDNTLRDLVINFRKPKEGEFTEAILITGTEDERSFKDKVLAIITDYLSANPGASKDRIYEEIISSMVRKGELESHSLDTLLCQVAERVRNNEEKIERWYLKDVAATVDVAESAKEDAAASKVSVFVAEYLKKNPYKEGVHFSDLIDYYFYAVKDKPRRPPVEWFHDYFVKVDSGTYRLPQSEGEERLKAEARTKGIHLHIKRFIAYLQQGVAIPSKEQPNDATLVEWLRYCKRSGLYEQGKLLYEKGGLKLDSLPEEMMVNVEEDYQVCVRMLARGLGSESEGKSKRAKRKN